MAIQNKALKSAGLKTSTYLTADLRAYLVDFGWDEAAASAVRVVYNTVGGFQLKISGTYKKAAETLEYGNESSRPTAAIRKYFNTPSRIESLYQSALQEELEIKI
jgi:hypothetical protein